MLDSMKDVCEKVLRNKDNHVEIVVRKKDALIRYYQVGDKDGQPAAICCLIQPSRILKDRADVIQLVNYLDFNNIADNNIYIGVYSDEAQEMQFWKLRHYMEYMDKLQGSSV